LQINVICILRLLRVYTDSKPVARNVSQFSLFWRVGEMDGLLNYEIDFLANRLDVLDLLPIGLPVSDGPGLGFPASASR
jgi:hypothetical protein